MNLHLRMPLETPTPCAVPESPSMPELHQSPIWSIWHAWNWKSALLSALFRAPVFILTGFEAGWRSVLGAVLAESLYRSVVSGFYGAIAQRLTRVRPRWKAMLVLVFALPFVEQVLDYLLHRARGTYNLNSAILVSCIVMAVSATFNWYAMNRGVLLTDSGDSFWSDLKRLPGVLFAFLLAGPVAIWNHFHSDRR